jgi:hypothetical protein
MVQIRHAHERRMEIFLHPKRLRRTCSFHSCRAVVASRRLQDPPLLYIASPSRAGGGGGSGEKAQKEAIDFCRKKKATACAVPPSEPDGNRDDEDGRFVDRRLQLAALLVLVR